MRNSSYADVWAKCPFYTEQGPTWIKCEGLTQRGSLTLRFKSGGERERWLSRHCNTIKGCQKCPLWEALWKDWERKHPEGGKDGDHLHRRPGIYPQADRDEPGELPPDMD